MWVAHVYDGIQALIPQLCHPLLPDPDKKSVPQLQLASLRALCSVIDNCSPRIHKWKGTILSAIAYSVVSLDDAEKAGKPGTAQIFLYREMLTLSLVSEARDLQEALREVYTKLERAVPDVQKVGFSMLLCGPAKLLIQ